MQTKTKLKGMSTFSYEMKLTDQGSQIKNATTEEIIQFSPFNILNGAAQMEAKYGYSNNVLELILSTNPHEKD